MGGHNEWQAKRLIIKLLHDDSQEKVVIVAVRETAASVEFKRRSLSLKKYWLLQTSCAYGTQFSPIFDLSFASRLGLSATPERYGDEEGTSRV